MMAENTGTKYVRQYMEFARDQQTDWLLSYLGRPARGAKPLHLVMIQQVVAERMAGKKAGPPQLMEPAHDNGA